MDSKKGLPDKRRAQILSWLAEEGPLTISELQDRLDVSHMTVHRDLNTLAKEGLVQKIHGGVKMVSSPVPKEDGSLFCALCGGRVASRSEVVITSVEKGPVSACCPHCALLLLAENKTVESALAKDFLYGRIVNLFQAVFVVHSQVRLCCVPSTLCFATEGDAVKFQRGFGGEVMNFDTAVEHLIEVHKRH